MSKISHRHVPFLKTTIPELKKKQPELNGIDWAQSGNLVKDVRSTVVVVIENQNTEENPDSDMVEKSRRRRSRQVNSSHLLEYYQTFFNLGYFLLIIPFRLVKEKKVGSLQYGYYIVQSHPLQKILCGAVQTLIAYEYLSKVRVINYSNIDGTPISYLNVATVLASFLYVVFFIYVFWAKESHYKAMFYDLQHLEFIQTSPKKTNSARNIRLLSIGFCVFAAIVALTDPIIHDGFIVRETNQDVLKKYACKARSYYLFKPCPDVPAEKLLPNESLLDYFVFGIHLFVLIPNLIMVHIVDVCVVLTAICLWKVLKYFIEYSKLETTSAEEALTHYEVLKRLVINTNSAVGLLTFSAVAVSLPFYASWAAIVFNSFNNSMDWLYFIHVLTYFVNFFLILTYGADFNFKVGEFYGRISAPNVAEGLKSHRLISILIDQQSNQISIRGCAFFSMTYRFFGTILSIIVTYSIIILQFQFSRRNMSNINCTYVQILNSTSV